MQIERFGSGDDLDALCDRLEKKCFISSKQSLDDIYNEAFAGLYYQGITIDINRSLHWYAQQRANEFAEDAYVELSCFCHPCAAQCGFYLFVAGSDCAKTRIKPILNILAPQDTAWLNCGEVGAASFCAAVFNSLCYPLNDLILDMDNFAKVIFELWINKHNQLLKNLFNLSTDYINSKKNIINKQSVFSLNNFADFLALHLQQMLFPLLNKLVMQ